MHNNPYIVSAEVISCDNQTITVKNLPFWFSFSSNKYMVQGTDIKVIDYIGNEEIGLLYLNKIIQIPTGNHLNLIYI